MMSNDQPFENCCGFSRSPLGLAGPTARRSYILATDWCLLASVEPHSLMRLHPLYNVDTDWLPTVAFYGYRRYLSDEQFYLRESAGRLN